MQNPNPRTQKTTGNNLLPSQTYRTGLIIAVAKPTPPQIDLPMIHSLHPPAPAIKTSSIKIGGLIVLLGLMFGGPGLADDTEFVIRVVDQDSNQEIPARVYLSDGLGTPTFFDAGQADQSPPAAVRYEVTNWLDDQSHEFHTTIIQYPATCRVPPGEYTLTIERGKTYFPHIEKLRIDGERFEKTIPLKRWFDTEAANWFSGDTHLHRSVEELRNVALAENLNVVFPLVDWVTDANTSPDMAKQATAQLFTIDDHHVIWPKNTEYEIFHIDKQPHTLGALFVLGHTTTLRDGVPPWGSMVQAVRENDPDVMFELDKVDWPSSVVLPALAPDALYEIANNHMWRTKFAFKAWNSATPSWMQPPFGGSDGTEREWLEYTTQLYYGLLNCGLRLPPTAGTANGVHPVPAGFSRVYVHLPDGFSYQRWLDGMRQGRSFVTNGPMLFGELDNHAAGHIFKFSRDQLPAGQLELTARIKVVSEQPLLYGEVIVNGVPQTLLYASNQRLENGAYETVLDPVVRVERSGWVAFRFYESREPQRVRFAHTAPWYIEIDEQPVRIPREQKRYFTNRMEIEIARSRDVLSEPALAEYGQALQFYQRLPELDDSVQVQQSARSLGQGPVRDAWIENMLVHHRLNASELRLATGMPIESAEAMVLSNPPAAESESASREILVLPYPGGRHPRRGFLDGAIDPSRETKVSIFPPWKGGGYVVVDVPEAVFSNLGLTYLAHTHIPTIWDDQSITLERTEWTSADDALISERQLPNGIIIRSRVAKKAGDDDSIAMRLELFNGTEQTLTGLKVQVCTMLSAADGFQDQIQLRQVIESPYVAVGATDAKRWIVTAWTPCDRVWTNPPVPCIHSDPVFPDCPPGDTVAVEGKIWFYEGDTIGQFLQGLQTE